MDGAPGLHGTFVHPESSSLPSLRLQAQWRMSVDGAGSIGSTYTYESESSLTVTNSYAHRRSSRAFQHLVATTAKRLFLRVRCRRKCLATEPSSSISRLARVVYFEQFSSEKRSNGCEIIPRGSIVVSVNGKVVEKGRLSYEKPYQGFAESFEFKRFERNA